MFMNTKSVKKKRRTVSIKKFKINCKNCGYSWKPEPRKWKNNAPSRGSRILHCPACGSKNKLTGSDIGVILEELRHEVHFKPAR